MENQNNDNDLQKAIDDITKEDAAVGGNGNLVEEIAAKFAEKAKVVPEGDAQVAEMPVPEVKVPENIPEIGMPMPPAPAPAPAPSGLGEDADVQQVKVEALRDLAPLVEKLEMSAEDKFKLYDEMVMVLKDKGILGKMHEAARSMADEGERAKALLKVVETINSLWDFDVN